MDECCTVHVCINVPGVTTPAAFMEMDICAAVPALGYGTLTVNHTDVFENRTWIDDEIAT